MIRLQTFAALQKITSAFLNNLQDAIAPVSSFDGFLRGGDLRVTSAGNVVARVISALILQNTFGSSNGSELSVTPGELDPAALYFVYVYMTGPGPTGNLALEVSEDGPDLALVFKDGDTSRRYLGAILTDGGGDVLGLQRSRGRNFLVDTGEPVLLSAGQETSYTDVSLGNLPSYASTVLLKVQAFNTTGNQQIIYLRAKGSSQDDFTLVVDPGVHETVDVELVCEYGANTGVIQYKVSSNGGSEPFLSLIARGWTEPSNP